MTFTYIKLQTFDEMAAEQGSSADPGPGFQVVRSDYTQDQMNDFRFFGQTFLNGGYLEPVSPRGLPRTLWDLLATTMRPIDMSPSWKDILLFMMVDDEGMLKNLSPNVHGTILYQTLGGVIFGPALVLCKRRDEIEGDIVVTFPEELDELTLSLAMIHTLYQTSQQ